MEDAVVGGRARRRAIRRRGVLLTVTVAAALMAACSSGSSGSSGSSSASSSPSDGQLAFAQCMRAHGVHDYPDSGNRLGTAGPGSDLNPNNPTYQSARQACQSLLPTHPAQQQQQNYTTQLAFSKCMRNHGISNYPDPDPHGGPGGHGGINLNGLGIDQNSPQFQSAQQACQHYLGGAGK